MRDCTQLGVGLRPLDSRYAVISAEALLAIGQSKMVCRVFKLNRLSLVKVEEMEGGLVPELELTPTLLLATHPPSMTKAGQPHSKNEINSSLR